ncbi:MAG: hypothetical protein IPL71_06965 [Anaerolineales bacterium]|uniref:hypothetical protein n=1 Tax=Candidatus Villigracilis proximus TaxID=3140683 RepID=UPI003136313A|nr:hypothetical protein [Anaerolineales bacterium]
MQPIIRLYKIEDFEPITRLWFDAQTVAMPKLMKRMSYEFEDACEFFSRVVITENQIWVYEQETLNIIVRASDRHC